MDSDGEEKRAENGKKNRGNQHPMGSALVIVATIGLLGLLGRHDRCWDGVAFNEALRGVDVSRPRVEVVVAGIEQDVNPCMRLLFFTGKTKVVSGIEQDQKPRMGLLVSTRSRCGRWDQAG